MRSLPPRVGSQVRIAASSALAAMLDGAANRQFLAIAEACDDPAPSALATSSQVRIHVPVLASSSSTCKGRTLRLSLGCGIELQFRAQVLPGESVLDSPAIVWCDGGRLY